MLVDASVWIDHFKNRGSAAALQPAHWLGDDPGRILVDPVVTTELPRGVRDEAATGRLLSMLDKLPQAGGIDCADWLTSARIHRVCRGAGLTIRSPMDCLLAAHALRPGASVLAVDRDFDAIASQLPPALHAPTAH